jgi:hypothetical protein
MLPGADRWDGAREDVAHGGNASLMLLGHIDLVDRHAVRGWAADTDRPYGTLEVAVFVDGRLAGLARADQARDDLREPATLGAGAHGIAYQFDPPLSAGHDHDVIVRFAEGGRLLGQWRVAREPAGATPPPIAPPSPEAVPSQADPQGKPAVTPGATPEATSGAATNATPASPAKPSPRVAHGRSGALPGEILAGYVDVCTREEVSGWAASKTDPDEVLDISILVNDRKVAQVNCNLPRADLAKAGQYGDGARAFVYRFDPPLPAEGVTRVTIVHSRTGMPMTGGDMRLADGKLQRLEAPAALAEDEPRLLAAPANPRSLFEWLGLYDDAGGLARLLSRLAFAGERPERMHYAVFGAHPQAVADALRWGTYYPRDHLHELLLSDAFQTGLIPAFLRAFPEKRRLIFVHIPKCAGTDLAFHFRARHPSLERSLTDPDWTPKPAMLRRIARVVAHVRTSDSIFVHGHINLSEHIAAGIIRPTDRVFTVIRDPLSAAISQINYVLTRFEEDIVAGTLQPDTAEWSRVLDLGPAPARMSDDFIKRLTSAALRANRVTVPNSQCLWLGGEGTQAVVDRLASYDVEVTEVDRYNAWLLDTWGIEAKTRWNASKKFIALQDLTTDDLGYLVGITREDQRLYRTVERLLTETGKLSLTGEDLRGVVAR